MPASRHISRSPCIALAVIATMRGRASFGQREAGARFGKDDRRARGERLLDRLDDNVRPGERLGGPAEFLAGAGNFFGAERGTVGRGRALFGRRAITDDGLAPNQAGPRVGGLGVQR